jgi:hypothetical protein
MNRRHIGRLLRVVLLATAAAGPPPCCRAQGTPDDYRRADALRERTSGKVIGGRVEPHWLPSGTRFWYRRERAEGLREFLVVDAVAGTSRPAFDPVKLAAALDRATGTRTTRSAYPSGASRWTTTARSPSRPTTRPGVTWATPDSPTGSSG